MVISWVYKGFIIGNTNEEKAGSLGEALIKLHVWRSAWGGLRWPEIDLLLNPSRQARCHPVQA